MNELIKINYDSDRPTVLGRDLHEALEVETPYNKWFPRMCEYGFAENTDYQTFLSNRSDGKAGKPKTDHQRNNTFVHLGLTTLTRNKKTVVFYDTLFNKPML